VTVGKLDIKLSERSGKIINQEGNSQGSNITENWLLRVSHLAKFRGVCQQGIKLGMDSHLCAFLRPRIIFLNRLWQRLLRKVSFHRSTLSNQDSGCQTSSQNGGPRDSKMGPRWFVEGGAGYMSFLAISQLQNLEICLMLTMSLLTSLTGCRDI
jgi:hypothetical protein